MDTHETSRPSPAASSTDSQALELPSSRYPLSLAEEASVAAAVKKVVDAASGTFGRSIAKSREIASKRRWDSANTRWSEVGQRESTDKLRSIMVSELTPMLEGAIAVTHRKLDSETSTRGQVDPGTRPDIYVRVLSMRPTGMETAVGIGSQIELATSSSAGERVVGIHQSDLQLERTRQKDRHSPWSMTHTFDLDGLVLT
jgi:hypothetical protein